MLYYFKNFYYICEIKKIYRYIFIIKYCHIVMYIFVFIISLISINMLTLSMLIQISFTQRLTGRDSIAFVNCFLCVITFFYFVTQKASNNK